MTQIYLAGPISGQTYEQATQWRHQFQLALPDWIRCLSPMRGKDYLQREISVADKYDDHPLCTQEGIMARDYFDAMRCDLMVVNLLGAERVSIGTVMEMAWAYTTHKPLIAIMEERGNPHDHSMLRECIGFRVTDILSAAKLAKAIL